MREYGSRIIVIGCPGAGKSTFARKLRDKTGLPLYYLDMLYHKPDRTAVTRGEFDKKLSAVLRTDKWIIDGNYQRTLPLRFKACMDVFFWICLWKSVCGASPPGSARRAKTCRGSNRNSIPGFGSISWIFGRTRSR